MAAVPVAAPTRAPRRRGSGRGALGILFAPVTLLIVLFLAPMVIMAWMSVVKYPPNTASPRTLEHYVDVLTNPLNWKIAWTTLWIGTTAMIIMLGIAIPLAYYMVFRAGRWELFLLLSLVLADELAPVVKVYAWQVILGRNGIVNWFIPGPPRSWSRRARSGSATSPPSTTCRSRSPAASSSRCSGRRAAARPPRCG